MPKSNAVRALNSIHTTPLPTGHPAWIDAAIAGGWAQNTWATISGASPTNGLSATNNVNAVAPSDAASRGDAAAVMSSWCGGAYASKCGNYGALIAYGGGHGDYCGNEVYKFDIETRTWSRITEPSPDASLPFTGLTAGWWPAHGLQTAGSPAVIHSYEMNQYHPGRNSFYTFFGLTASGVNTSTPHTGELPLSTNVWVSRATSSFVYGLEGWSTYDSLRDKFIIHAAGPAHTITYTPSTDTYAQFTQSDESWAVITDTVAVYDPVNDVHIVLNPTTGNLHGLSASNLSSDAVTLTSSSKPTITGQGGFDYSAVLGGLLWCSGTNADVYLITKGSGTWDVATWTWVKLTAAGNSVTPESNESAGPYNRFRVVEYGSTAIVLMVKRTGLTGTGSVYAFRLT